MGWRVFLSAVAAAWLAAMPAQAQDAGRRLLLVTLDGLHWTEVFRGADPKRAADPAFAGDRDLLRRTFVDPPDRARALMPFLHEVVARQGVLIGDRDRGSCAAVANDQWFSYPGYNEILTGRPDPKITSNEHGPNANVTFLEWLNRQPGFAGKVQVAASWNAYGDIVNAERSGLKVQAGWEASPPDSPAGKVLQDLPRLWDTVRYDGLTQADALRALRRDKPRVLYVAFGETDDFAHDGRYDQTLWAARRADRFLRELWDAAQADPAWRGRTTLIVTTDHGRGSAGADGWRHHGRQHAGSDAVWIAALGPTIGKAPAPGGCASSSQVAATALKALGFDWRKFDPQAGAPLDIFR